MTKLAKSCSFLTGFCFSRGERNEAINVDEKEKYGSSKDGRAFCILPDKNEAAQG